MGLENWLTKRLSETMESGTYRTLKTTNTAPSSKMEIDGRKQIVFSSNNYLGLASNESCIYAAETILHQFGVGSGGPSIMTGYTTWHQKLEEKIAEFTQTEAALLFSNASLANVGVISSIPEKGDIILCDEFNHVSAYDGCQLSKAECKTYCHLDVSDLEDKLSESQTYKRRFIVTKGVFSLDGTIAPLDRIMSLAKQYQAFVIVDDTHGLGVLGEYGRGTSEVFKVKPDVVIGSLSHAVGADGGFVCGSKVLIDFLRNTAKCYIFETSIPPAICAASYAAFEIIEKSNDKRQRLLDNVNYVRTRLGDMGFFVKGDLTPIIPVIIGDSHQAEVFSLRLEEEGVFVLPTPQLKNMSKESIIGVTITADHCDNDIEYLLSKFQLIGKEMDYI